MFTFASRARWITVFILSISLFAATCPPAHAQLKEVLAELFKPSVPRAIERGLAPGGDLAYELEQVGDVEIATLTQARAIVKLSKTFPRPAGTPRPETKSHQSALAALTTLYSNVIEDSPAMNLILEQGIPELVRIYDTQVKWSQSDQVDKEDLEDLVEVLTVLAMFCTSEGTDRVMNGIERNLAPESYAWGTVFAVYTHDHPETERFLTWVSGHLPEGALGRTLLFRANQVAGQQVTYRHPFNNQRGVELLKSWLAIDSEDQNEFEAWSAVVAIAHMDPQYRRELFELTERFKNKRLILEAAWTRAKVDDEEGFKRLEEFCLDVSYSSSARRYLEELKASDRIPIEALEPEFVARAEMIEWLSDARELGSAPDELAIVDQRELKWFDAEEPALFSIVSYCQKSSDPLADDDRGVGVVGSITMSFMDPNMLNYLPEDTYALHYGWEAENSELITRVDDATEQGHAQTIKQQLQNMKQPVDEFEFLEELKFAPEFGYPGERILLLESKRQGQPGLMVLDADRSRFYSNAEFGTEVSVFTVGRIHIGRTMLGFDLDVKRNYQPYPEFEPAPQLVVDTYQQLFPKLTETIDEEELTETLSRLAIHYQRYIEALTTTGGLSRQAAVKQTFETAWSSYHRLPDEHQLQAFDELDLIGQSIVEYAQSLAGNPDGQKRVAEIVAELEMRWDSNLGRDLLATAAHSVGLEDTAVRLFEKQFELEMPGQHVGEMPHVLAVAWQKRGKMAEAKKLLVDSLRSCLSDLENLERDESPDDLRSQIDRLKDTYRRLFPDTAESELKAAGV